MLLEVVIPLLLGFGWGMWTARNWRPDRAEGWLIAAAGGGALGLMWNLYVLARLQ